MASKLPWLAVAGAFSVGVLGMIACKSEGPDAPPRKNGCIDTGCAPVTTAAPPSSTDSGASNGATTSPLSETEDLGESDGIERDE